MRGREGNEENERLLLRARSAAGASLVAFQWRSMNEASVVGLSPVCIRMFSAVVGPRLVKAKKSSASIAGPMISRSVTAGPLASLVKRRGAQEGHCERCGSRSINCRANWLRLSMPRRLQGVTLYREVDRAFAAGDRVQMTAPYRDRHVATAAARP